MEISDKMKETQEKMIKKKNTKFNYCPNCGNKINTSNKNDRENIICSGCKINIRIKDLV